MVYPPYGLNSNNYYCQVDTVYVIIKSFLTLEISYEGCHFLRNKISPSNYNLEFNKVLLKKLYKNQTIKSHFK